MLQRSLRRRSRLLFLLAASATVVFLLLGYLYVFLSDGTKFTSSLGNERCGWLPALMCAQPHFEVVETYEDAKSNVLIADLDKAKLKFIVGSYKGERSKSLKMGHDFYEQIMKVIKNAKPTCGKLDNYPNGPAKAELVEIATGSNGRVFSEKYLSDALKLDESQKELMAASHKYALENLPENAPKGLYLGTGIAYVGGGKFNWMVLLSLRQLRARGCELPVEIFIPSLEEFELELCSAIFPLLNARCVHIPTALYKENESPDSLKFGGYQFKCLAIMLSSFENVLLLDSDNIPAHSPEAIFTNEPYLSKGLIVWPDYWHRTTSPDYYSIAGIEISRTKVLPKFHEKPGERIDQDQPGENFDWENYPYHEREGAIPDPSTESGQLVINKKTHMKSLLLALYYNLYGPDYYYPLLSQGGSGEGDKETFLAAAVVTHKPFYQIMKFLGALGNIRDGNFNGNGMGQHDPVQDYKWSVERHKLRKSLKGADFEAAVSQLKEPGLLFIHANHPKLDPWGLVKEHQIIQDNGERLRLYGWDLKDRVGSDVELDLWNYMDQLLCDWKINIDHYSEVDRSELCKEVRAHRDWLLSTAKKD